MNHAGSDNLQQPINSVVALLQGELDELLQQKASIKLRARTLRRRLSTLEGKSSRNSLTRSKFRRKNVARRAHAGQLRQLHEELRRACRIAFLELGGTATPDELYSAIMRRGSFSFGAIKENPAAAITHALTSMAQHGEATCSTNGSPLKWTYNSDASPFQWSS